MLADENPIHETPAPADDDIAAELRFLLTALDQAPGGLAREDLSELPMVEDAIALATPRDRYQPRGPIMAKVAAAGLATFPAVLAPVPSFANEPLPVNMMIAMAERPKTTPGLGATGTQLFPFSRPMQAVRTEVSAPPELPGPEKVKLPLNPRVKALFAESRQVKLTTKRQAAATFYTVAKGDSLYVIAARLLGSGARWREIMDANKEKIASTYLLMPGTRLVIPTPRQVTDAPVAKRPAAPLVASLPAPALPAGKPPAEHAPAYRVEKGDSLYVIAARHLGDPQRWREIVALNKAQLNGKTVIYPNQWLILPTVT